MPRSLQEVIGNPFLNDSRLAAIIGQIVEGLGFLEKEKLQYSELNCSRILIHSSGWVKISGREYIKALDTQRRSIQDLGCVMMELMQGYVKEGPQVGLDNPDRWAPDTINFLCATTSASSIDELKGHSFLASWNRRKLQGLFCLVLTWSQVEYEYAGWQ
ncbi:hypothetical protein Forpi1262_v007140 [Fusarium oxysporum f. sp. raphani]|uniref:Protein kinase domain-containing protein n=1 Tax=Fusarium oxysporum f. sp. raphani TaxID=96318 RepID=A0A8J5Q3D3_FUSOX|nr:hypothetical protein Forpi1262_v007140 [Fusarium oxysporum f. sp. raphani]